MYVLTNTDMMTSDKSFNIHGASRKKAGRSLVRKYVGSSKNLLPERQRNAQQNTKMQSSCAGISFSGAKEQIIKHEGFTYSFAEITDKKEPGIRIYTERIRFQPSIYIMDRKKSRG